MFSECRECKRTLGASPVLYMDLPVVDVARLGEWQAMHLHVRVCMCACVRTYMNTLMLHFETASDVY